MLQNFLEKFLNKNKEEVLEQEEEREENQIQADLHLQREIYRKYLEKVEKFLKERYGEKTKEILNLAKKKQIENKDEHISITLDALSFISFSDTYNILKEILNEMNIDYIKVGSIYDLKVKDDKLFYKDKEVILDYFPKNLQIEKDKILFIIPYYEYKALKKINLSKSIESLKKFSKILEDAIKRKTSDIHIIPKKKQNQYFYYVFFRINKILVPIPEYLMSQEEGLSLIKVLMLKASEETKGKFRAEETKIAQDARVSFDELNVDLRLEFIPDGQSLKHLTLCARIIKRQELKGDVSLEEKLSKLNYDKKTIQVLKNVSKAKGKIIVISGITNSGKSTLLSNIISSIEKTKRIVTVEDPVETYILNENVTQHQVYIPKEEEMRMSFVEYAKAFKRADPDIVVIGEWREDPALTEAIKSMAFAGQLVFTTTHIASAYQIYEALRDVYKVDEKTTASFLLLSFNQALIPRLCEKCKREVKIKNLEEIYSLEEIKVMPFSDYEKEILKYIIEEKIYKEGEIKIYKQGDGCKNCDGTGIKGLLPVYEYFINTDEIKEAVLRNRVNSDQLKKLAREKNLGTLKIERFINLLFKGLVDKESIYKI